MDESQERWVSVTQAVAESGVPERSLYRWIKAKRLPTRTNGGSAMVELGAVRALAATRRTVRGAAVTGNPVGTSGGGGNLAKGDPETDSLILAKLDQGDRPLDLVRDLRVAPQRVRALAEELAKLKALERGVPVADQLGALQATQDQHSAKISALVEGMGELGAMLEDLKGRFASLPFPANRTAYACGGCGARGLYVVPLRCSCCGREQPSGFYPQRSN